MLLLGSALAGLGFAQRGNQTLIREYGTRGLNPDMPAPSTLQIVFAAYSNVYQEAQQEEEEDVTAFMPVSKPASMVFLVCLNTAAQELVLRNIHVEKKPGQESGPVMATVNGKPRRILPEATQVWAVMGGKNALVLIPPSKKESQNKEYHLRFYDTSAHKGRFLGTVPFAQAEFSELKLTDGSWIFLLSGADPQSKEPLLVVADVYAIRAQLAGAKARTPDEQSLSALLAPDMLAIFETTTPARTCSFCMTDQR